MSEQPKRAFARSVRRTIEQSTRAINDVNDYEDSIVTWLVGLSGGWLTLLALDSSNRGLVSGDTVVLGASMLLGSMICGILSRLAIRTIRRRDFEYLTRVESELGTFEMQIDFEESTEGTMKARIQEQSRKSYEALKQALTESKGASGSKVLMAVSDWSFGACVLLFICGATAIFLTVFHQLG